MQNVENENTTRQYARKEMCSQYFVDELDALTIRRNKF